MANIDELKQYKHIHMIGIGGVSMSGIAEILKIGDLLLQVLIVQVLRTLIN